MPASALYDSIARHVLQPAYQSCQLMLPGRRAKARAFAEGLRLRAEAQDWSKEQKADWVLARLRTVVRDAATYVPYYRDLLREHGFDARADFGFAEFAKLPPLDRGAIRARGATLLDSRISPTRLRRDATGGSTGEPTVVWKGPQELGWAESGVEHFMRRLGVPAGSRLAHFWGHHLDPVTDATLYERLQDLLMNRRWFECFRLSESALDAHHDALTTYLPDALICYAGALANLAERLKLRGERPRYPLRALVTGAEKLYEHQRVLIQEVFGRPVVEQYGSRDVGLMAYQLPADDWREPGWRPPFFVDWPNVFLEREDEEPESQLLVTKLHADGMPMIRYRVGDIARFARSTAPGEPVFTVEEVIGRDLDRIRLPDGSCVHSISFPHLFKDQPVREFEVYQSVDYGIEVRVVPTAGYSAANAEAIARTVRANVGHLPVAVHEVSMIARGMAGKWRPVRSDAPVCSATRQVQ